MAGKCKSLLLAVGAVALSMVIQREARAANAARVAAPPLPAPAAAPMATPAPVMAALVMAAPLNTMFGPPAICFPIDIGEAESLPWADAGNPMWSAKMPGYDVTRCVDDTLAILDGSDDALVHMETLRRFGVYVSGIGGNPPKTAEWRAMETQRLLSNLEQRAERGVTKTAAGGGHAHAAEVEAAGRRLGLAWFDLAYLKVVLSQSGLHRTALDMAALQTALELRPGDGALHFGAAVAAFDSRESRKLLWPNLDKALTLADDRDGLLSRNIVAVMGHFVGASTREELEQKVARELDAA